MISVNRLRGAVDYLRGADSFYRWRLAPADCPQCGPSHFAVLRPDPFFTRCVICKATVVNLAVIRAIQQHVTALSSRCAYEMSTYGSTYSFLKKNCGKFFCSEFFPGHQSGEWVGGIRNEDAQALSFADGVFDIITSNQVFEHVPDDIAAYKECWRTLKPGGSLMFTVPLHDSARSEQVAVVKNGMIHWLSTPEFHGSRTTGPRSVPTFWRFSVNDIAERVALCGFDSVSILKVIVVPKVQPQMVVHAVKGAAVHVA